MRRASVLLPHPDSPQARASPRGARRGRRRPRLSRARLCAATRRPLWGSASSGFWSPADTRPNDRWSLGRRSGSRSRLDPQLLVHATLVLLDLLNREDAGGSMAWLLLLEARVCLVALVLDERTAGAEVASLWKEDQTRRSTLYRQEPHLSRGIQAWRRAHHRPRVRHQGVVEDLVRSGLLDGAPRVHHHHLVRELGDHA